MTSTCFFSHVRTIVRRSCHLVLLLSLVFAASTPASKLVAATETNEVSSTKRAVTVSGTVFDAESGETLVGVNIMVKGKVIGTSSDANGRFDLSLDDDPPITLVVSIVGFQTQEIEITGSVDDLRIDMQPQAVFGSDVVVSASRVEQDILKAPVAIEKLDILSIRESASTSFYEALANLKGVDFSTQSLTFRSVNTRGFNANGNTRFVQLIDGIDNQAPGLNFSVGNVAGITELDLATAELMPGSASALYGPNALNGILLLESKSPFTYQGLSFNVTSGVNHVDSGVEDPSLYQKYSFRYAKSFNDRFAFKITGSFLEAQDFVGEDYRDISGSGINRLYDGQNSYGEFVIDLRTVAQLGIATSSDPQTVGLLQQIFPLLPTGLDGAFSPTGYREIDFVDNTTNSTKLGAALHYRITDELELIGQFNTGFGSTVYTANDRFVLDNFNIWTAKLELRGPSLMLRAYKTQENTGDAYAANTLTQLINQQTYLNPYLLGYAGALQQGAGNEAAHAAARANADAERPSADSEAFKTLFNQLRNIPISEGGAKFLDQSALYHLEGLYNFSEMIDSDQFNLVAGFNLRQYNLDSEGTLFALDNSGNEFTSGEWGSFLQTNVSLTQNLEFTGSVRYDKNENFDGQFSPRAALVATFANNHNLRVAYQTGFRNPSMQDQFIDLDVVSRRLVGSNPVLIDQYNFETNPVYTTDSYNGARLAALTGMDPGEAAARFLQPVTFDNDLQPEKNQSFEVGYRALLGDRLFVDAYYYYTRYTDYIAEIDFIQGVPNGLKVEPNVPGLDKGSDLWKTAMILGTNPLTGAPFATQAYGFDVNADGNVDAQGYAISLDYDLSQGYKIGGNLAYNELISEKDLVDQGFRADFNAPKWRYNIRFSNRTLTPNVGFNLTWRWQDEYYWSSSIGSGDVPAYGTLDAQVTYKFKELNTLFKLGGTNVLNERYTTSIGNPLMGSIFYVSLTFDELLN
ncbi:MAG TPA: hypothetical protein DEF03_03740 [Bacteroidetes bacterium]|nr:hypothetical protein [Bacteroidota bacterium]